MRWLVLAVLALAGCNQLLGVDDVRIDHDGGDDAPDDAGIDGPPACTLSGDTCVTNAECCTDACVDNRCACAGDGDGCTAHEQCCGGSCSPEGTCTALSGTCLTSGNRCGSHTECCSHYCLAGTCSPSPSYCVQAGDACAADDECCSGMCDRTVGDTLGLCRPVTGTGATCRPAGEVCGAGASGGTPEECGADCCGRACVPHGPTGVLICEPPTGCRPTGEICQVDADCCGSASRPDGPSAGVTCVKAAAEATGRCSQSTSCTPAGGTCRHPSLPCNANSNCCAGNVLQFDTCRFDNLGIPRCTVAADIDCASPASRIGQTCATSADCCGVYPCVPDGAGVLRCAAGCVPSGGTCTTAADCCSRLPCELAPGALTGTCGLAGACSDYGQVCASSSDCCNNVPCTGGFCRY
jgi:hypothetical protein